jgi:2-polyprenyl-6-methoxyphenol hydroxylase-like FAD-dependent oxidoreductase
VAGSARANTAFVVGADGHNSIVRRSLGAAFPEVAPSRYYAVFELHGGDAPGNEVSIVLGDRTTDVLWPLPGNAWRWSFQLPDYADSEAEGRKDRLLEAGLGYFPTRRSKDRSLASEPEPAPVLEDAHLRELLAERAPWFQSRIDKVTWRTIVRFENRLTATFGRGRLWLAGDAAHLAGPAAVASMNLGLAEGHDLAGRIARVLRRGAGPEELDCYAEHWAGVWRRFPGFEQESAGPAEPDTWIRRRASRILASIPAHGPAFDHVVAQLGLGS